MKYLKCDVGPEVKRKELHKWSFNNNVEILFSRPGTPTVNRNIESFNGIF
ncbi:transposase family protein [Oceanispirochaeta crateris]|nr:transposase family protein [Oceanispirochaeta crateris]